MQCSVGQCAFGVWWHLCLGPVAAWLAGLTKLTTRVVVLLMVPVCGFLNSSACKRAGMAELRARQARQPASQAGRHIGSVVLCSGSRCMLTTVGFSMKAASYSMGSSASRGPQRSGFPGRATRVQVAANPTDVQRGSGMGPRSWLPRMSSLLSEGSAVLSPQAGGSTPVSWLKLRSSSSRLLLEVEAGRGPLKELLARLMPVSASSASALGSVPAGMGGNLV